MSLPKSIGVIFNGHAISDYFVINDVYRPLRATPRLSTKQVEGRDGTVLLGVCAGDYNPRVKITAMDVTDERLRRTIHELAGWLDVSEPAPLQFSDEPDMYRMAVPQTQGDLDKLSTKDAQVEITFMCPDPWIFGKSYEFDSSSGSCEFEIFGNKETDVYIYSSAASGNFSLMDETGNTARVAVGDVAKTLAIDSANSTVLVNGSAQMLSLDSDWITLAPGKHSLTRTAGSGEYRVSYTERWS